MTLHEGESPSGRDDSDVPWDRARLGAGRVALDGQPNRYGPGSRKDQTRPDQRLRSEGGGADRIPVIATIDDEDLKVRPGADEGRI